MPQSNRSPHAFFTLSLRTAGALAITLAPDSFIPNDPAAAKVCKLP